VTEEQGDALISAVSALATEVAGQGSTAGAQATKVAQLVAQATVTHAEVIRAADSAQMVATEVYVLLAVVGGMILLNLLILGALRAVRQW
jgi:hypothetical protein